MPSDWEKAQLERQGFLILEGVILSERLEALRARLDALFAEEGDRAGSEFRIEPNAPRLANLVAKGPIFEDVVLENRVLDRVACVLGSAFKLSSLNARTAPPQTACVQPLHVDAGAIPDERGYWVCNTIWLLDDFTPANGATRCVPGSHLWRQNPVHVLPDPLAPFPGEILLTAPAGSVVVMNAHMWHGGTANRTDRPRRAVHAFYCRADKPQQQYQKRLIPAELQAAFRPELRRILALDDPANDALCAASTNASGFLK